jgi:hypothetical protein
MTAQEKKEWLEAFSADLAAMTPEEFAHYQAEFAEWDVALMDGLMEDE